MGEYKESGIDWIGKIPTEWDVQPLGIYFEERREKVSDTDYEALSVTKNGIVKQLENVAKSDAHDDRKKVCQNDFVINSRSDRKQSCGLSEYDGSVSLINIVLKINQEKMYPTYAKYLLDNCMFAEEFYRNGHGIVADLWTTNFTDMKRISIPLPPFEEQKKLSKKLDDSIPKINSILENLNKQIEILSDYKKSKITEVVTNGLNSNVEYKESGIDWIGKIPKNWNIKKIKYIAASINKGNGITKEDVVNNGNISCVRYGEIYSKYNYSFNKCLTKTNEEKVASKQYFSYGDILFAGTGELVEEIGKNIAYLGKEKCLAGGDIIIVKHKENPQFLSYALNSYYGQAQKSYGKAKLKVVHISSTEIGNLMVVLPPIDNQQQIAEYLDKVCSEIDKIIWSKQKQIEKLETYKKSLIYEYVTGKKRVKGA